MSVGKFNDLTLGPGVIDVQSIPTDCPPWLRNILERMYQTFVGATMAPARKGDTKYQLVFAITTAGETVLYGAKPSDPINPDVLVVSAAGSATVVWQQNGSTIVTSGTFNTPTSAFLALTDDSGKARLTFSIDATLPMKITGNKVEFDHTTISGYSASGTKLLGIVDGVLTFLPSGAC